MLLEKEFPADDRVEKEAVSLIKNGFEVFLLCPDFGDNQKEEDYNGINIHRFSIKKSYFNKLLGLIQIFPLYKILWLNKVQKIISTHNIKIVHIHDLPLCCLINPLKRNNKLKFVADMHENYPAMVSGQEHLKKFPNKYLISIKKWYSLEKNWLRNADLIICTASGMVKRLRRQLVGNHNYILVPNTLNIKEFKSSQERRIDIERRLETGFNILSYGVVSEQRGIQYVIESLSLLKNKIHDIKLIILGDGPYLKTLEDQVQKLNVEKEVLFEGWQEQSSLISYMQNTQITIIPHIKSEHTDNTSPNKLFHFMYYGKPVLASNCNYIQEIVEEENCGIIYTYDNPKELANAITHLYSNEKERNDMGKNGNMAIINKYNWHSTIEPMLKEYKKLIRMAGAI